MGWRIAGCFSLRSLLRIWRVSPAHLNPAVTIGGLKRWFTLGISIPHILAQFAGAMLGQILFGCNSNLTMRQKKMQEIFWPLFSTAFSYQRYCIKSWLVNFWTFCFGIDNLLLLGLCSGNGTFAVDSLIGIGLSLRGTTGYAWTPARDLTRTMHSILHFQTRETETVLCLDSCCGSCYWCSLTCLYSLPFLI